MRLRLLLALLAVALPAAVASAATLEVTVNGVRNDRGHIRIGVCRKAEFLSEDCAFHAVVPARPGDVMASVTGITPGPYAVAVYQDEDDSGRLKRSFLGLPKEDLGFSRNPALGLGPPGFADSLLMIGSGNNRVSVTLRHFGS